MSKQPPNGQVPFQRGERLTAAKLNEWVTKRPSVEAFGHSHNEGGAVFTDERETMFVRLTNKTGSAPIKYAWQEVYRAANGTWVNMTHTGNVTNDYAIELNNANLSITDNYVYRAERSLTTGEWLFFLMRRTSGCAGGICSNPPTTVCANFPADPYIYADPPIYDKTPGEIQYYPFPIDTCPQFEWPNGLTSHAFNLYWKARSLVAESECVSALVGSTVQTTLSVKPEIEPFMPIVDIIEYEKDDFPNPCPIESYRKTCNVTLVDADILTDVTLSNNGSCGFNYSITRKLRITTNITMTEVDSFPSTPVTTVGPGAWSGYSPPFVNPEGTPDAIVALSGTNQTTDVYTITFTGSIPCDVTNITAT
jgi:hypothetical protein